MPLLAPFVPLFRELREMRYVWAEPLQLDNAGLLAVLGEEQRTPLDTAMRETLVMMGCLPPEKVKEIAKIQDIRRFDYVWRSACHL